MYPYIDFSKIYTQFTELTLQASDLDLEYKLIHRALNVKTKLKRFHITSDDHCTLCNQHAETYEHLFVQCYKIQEAKSYLEETIKDQINIQLDIQNSLHWVYPNHLTKSQTALLQMTCVIFHNAVWRHRNDVAFGDKKAMPIL